MYCEVRDILARIDEKVLINLTNDTFPATEVNYTVLNQLIEISEDMIDASLRNKYSLPLKSVPELIKQISADIVVYRLYARRPQDVPKNYQKNFDDAISILKDLQSGTKVLGFPSVNDTEVVKTPKMYFCDKTEQDRKFRGEVNL